MTFKNADIIENTEVEDSAINKVLPENLSKLRTAFLKHTVPEYDRYGDGFIAQAYFAARNSSTGKYGSIAKTLGLDKLTFQYYMEKYPDFVLAVNLGRADGMKERVENIENALLSRALGVEIEEHVEEQQGEVDEDGNIKHPFKKVRVIKKQVPPDTQAALAILQRIDPNWNPKSTVDVNLNQRVNVTEDVSINVDYRALSPDALKELLNSSKFMENKDINKTIDGESVMYLGENGGDLKERRKRSSDEHRERTKSKKKQQENEDRNNTVRKKTTTMSERTREEISNRAEDKYRIEKEEE